LGPESDAQAASVAPASASAMSLEIIAFSLPLEIARLLRQPAPSGQMRDGRKLEARNGAKL
jgi:hypothetical protein